MRIKNQGEQKIKQKVKTEIMKETGQKGTMVKKEKAKNREKGEKNKTKEQQSQVVSNVSQQIAGCG